MRISLELVPTQGDRLQGRVITGDGGVPVSFSGTLDLLRVIEELRCAHDGAADVTARLIAVTAQQR